VEYISKNEKQTIKIAKSIAKELKNGDIVLLFGDLGAGKTVFVRGLASRFSRDRVSSPSFAIMNAYKGKKTDVHHFDLYRLKSENELYGFGGEEQLFGDGIKVVEWPERAHLAGKERCSVKIEKLDENTRRISVEWKK
jgi:tRNA threonylcarbamoyladenosine biosynthesis protein TsaE